MVRSVESVALDILRSIEDRLITDGVMPLVATTAVEVALYILNQKRAHLNDIQQRYQVPIMVVADENMHVSQFVIDRAAEGEIADGSVAVHMDWAHHQELPAAADEAEAEPAKSRPKRRRRRRRTEDGEAPRQESASSQDSAEEAEEKVESASAEDAKAAETKEAGDTQSRKGPRRRGRRGGRRGRAGQRSRRTSDEALQAEADGERAAPADGDVVQNGANRRRDEAPVHEAEPVLETVPAVDTVSPVEAGPPSEAHAEIQGEEEAPRRRGWWQR